MAGELEPEDQALLDKIRGRQAIDGAALRVNTQQADPVNGDTFAAQRRVAQRLGLPVEAVVHTWDDARLEDKANSAAQVAGKSPALQQHMLDPDFARLVHDDTDALGVFVDGAKYLLSHPDARNTLMGDVGAGAYRASRGAAGVFQGAFELAAPPLDWLDNTSMPGGNPLRRVAEGFAMQGASAEAKAKALSPAVPGVVAGGISSGVQSLTQNLLTLPMAFLGPGGASAALTGMVSMTGGQSYQDAREQGLPMSQAVPFAVSQAAIEYATEKIPLATLLKNLKGGTSFIKTLAIDAGLEILGEQIATILQDLNEWAILPENKDKPFKAYLEERPGAAAQTLIATIIGAGGNVAVGKALEHTLGAASIDAENSRRAAEGAKTMGELLKLQAAMKLHERAPDVAGGLLQDLADETEGAPKEVRFDARQLADALQQAGVDASLFPSVVAQLPEALATGGEVTVPLGEFSRIAGTELEPVLLQHARIGDNELSQAEAKQASEQAAADVKARADEMLAQAAQGEEQKASADAVKARVFDELQKAGRFTKDVNEAYASLHAAFFATMAQRAGTTAEELFDRYALNVQATQPGGEALQAGGSLPGALAVEGYHFSSQDRPVLSTAFYGTGLEGSAREDILNHPDQRLRRRLSFYVDKGTGVRPESGVGGRAHRVQLTGIYDANADPLKLRGGDARAFESALLDRGYAGYLDRLEGTQPGQVVVLGDRSFQPELLGPLSRIEAGQRVEPLPAAEPQWQTQATGTPEQLNARLARMKDNPAWAKFELRIEGDQLQYRPATLAQSRVKDMTPEIRKLLKNLTPTEQRKITDATAAKVIAQLQSLPSAKEMAAVALGGQAKRGWYQESARAISEVFGPDAARFAALLAATSPQCSVEVNLLNALNIWKNWTAAGRPTGREAIIDVMGQSVQGGRGRASVLDAWINNSVRALSAENPADAATSRVFLSGPKVNSFFLNLIGVTDEVTNDAWMANYALVDQIMFSGSMNVLGTDPGKGAGYLAMAARTREAAAYLTKVTGETWTPAEVQETVWSWAKTLYELQVGDMTATRALNEGVLTDELINSTPDFSSLFNDPTYGAILKEAGYAEQLDTLGSNERPDADVADQEPAAGAEAAAFAPEAQARLRLQAARRLERLRTQRNAGRRERGGLSGNREPGYAGGGLAPLPGAPAIAGASGPDPRIVAVAEQYAAEAGIPLTRQGAYVQVDPERARRIAQAYEAMPDEPTNPRVREAYDNLIQQTMAQYLALERAGYRFYLVDETNDPYQGNPWNAMRDLRANQVMGVFSTEAGFGTSAALNIGLADPAGGPNLTPERVLQAIEAVGGQVEEHATHTSDTEPTVVAKLKAPLTKAQADQLSADLGQEAIAQRLADGTGALFGPQAANWGDFNPEFFLLLDGRRASEATSPLLADTGLEWGFGSPDGPKRKVLANDLFRAVHDAFGHGLEGAGFRVRGEENAWQAHVRLFTGSAVGAITGETRGQNSWLNYGPYGESNQTAKVEDTHFADQKTGLMPEWTWTEGRAPDAGVLEQSARPQFVSQLAKAIEAVPARLDNMTGTVWQQWLKANASKAGVKADEITWSGIEDFLAMRGKDKVSKADITAFLGASGVQVGEVVLGANALLSDAADEVLKAHDFLGFESLGQARRALQGDFLRLGDGVLDQYDFEAPSDGRAILRWLKADPGAGAAKYGDYRVPGGTNYREVLVTLPDTALPPYKSKHWTQPNVLVHFRADDRTDADGNKVLFLQDLQSDWGQGGKKHGFFDKPPRVVTKKDLDAFTEKAFDDHVALLVGEGMSKADAERATIDESTMGMMRRLGRADEFNAMREARYNPVESKAVPNAPFVTDTKAWVALGLKRALMMAIESGQDRVAVVNGDQAADMFDLSKQIDEVQYRTFRGRPGGLLIAKSRDGGRVIEEQLAGDDELADHIGKEVAQHLLSVKPENVFGDKTYSLDNAGLKVGGEGMRAFYDGIVPQVMRDLAKKLGGKMVESQFNPEDVGVNPDDWIGKIKQPAIEITPEMRERVLREGVPLFQDTPQGRGSVGGGGGRVTGASPSALATFTPSTNTISLLNGANLSSFLHESAHFFLEVITDMAAQPNAPADIVADVNALMAWFKTDLATWSTASLTDRRKAHERFAESFEQYLLEGKAPTPELQPMFRRFRAWMVNVYRSLKDFIAGRAATPGGEGGPAENPLELSDEVRAVFDRMLAAEDQIKQAEQLRHLTPLFREQPKGMSPAAWAAYQEQQADASDDAVEARQARSLRDMRWLSNAQSRKLKELQAQSKEARKSVLAEVSAEVDQRPIYQALRWLRKGEMVTAEGEEVKAEKGFRLSTAALAEMYPANAPGNPDLEKLKGLTAANGLHPDIVAGMFGFSSGDELVRKLVDVEPRTSVIEGMTDQRMLERYGDLATEAGMKRAVDEALHEESRGRALVTELKALRDGVADPRLQDTVDKAVRITDKARTAASLKAQRSASTRVLVKAAKEFGRQLADRRKVRELKPGLYAKAETRAAKLAEQALAKGDVTAAAQAKQDQVLQHYAGRAATEALDDVRRGREYLRRFDRPTKGIDQDYRDQIDKLLERVDLRQQSNTALDKRAKLSAWISAQEELGIEPSIPDYLLEDSKLTSYQDMTVEQFRGLVDAVKQIEHLGRLKNKLLLAKDKREFAAIVQSLVDSVAANAGDRKAVTRTPADTLGKALKGLRNFGAAHIKVASWARIMDGGKDGGPMWEHFVRVANEQGDWETERIAKATVELTAIMEPVLQAAKLGGKGTFFPTVNTSLNKEQVLAIALNTGNESNLQRLLGGEGWTLDQVQPVLATLTPADWKAVQAIWDYFESFRPEIGAKEKRIFGKEPEWIDAGSAVTDALGLRGGYYPVKYDPAASVRAEEHANAEEAKALLKGAYNAATTKRSFTKARAEEVVGRPLLYSLAGVYTGVQDVIHDLAWHEWLIDTNRLLRSQMLDSVIRSSYGPEVINQFHTWRDDIARGNQGAANALEMALGRLRQSVSVAGLGFNVVSALMQPLGITQSIVRVGAGWIGRGIMQAVANPLAAARKTNDMSSFMRSRARTRFRELNELRNRVQGQSAVKRAINENAYRLMMAFQQVVDVPTWLGAYEKAVAEGNDDKRAVALADQAVIDSQGGGQTKDLAAIERGGPALKLFMTFYSFMNTAANLGAQSAMTPRSRAKLASDMLLLFTVPAVLGALLKDALTPGDSGDDDWEKLVRKLAAEQLSFLLGLFVVGREFGQVAQTVTGAGSRDYAGPPGLRAIADSYKFATQAAQGEFDDSFRKASINLAGDIFGLPSAQINRSITGTKALIEGETSNPAAALMGYQRP